MEIDTNEDLYENLWLEWQYELALILKKELAKKGIKGSTAKDIVGDFLFTVSMLHDQGDVKFEDKEYNPRISFDNHEGVLITSKEPTSLHEAAFGNADEAFEG